MSGSGQRPGAQSARILHLPKSLGVFSRGPKGPITKRVISESAGVNTQLDIENVRAISLAGIRRLVLFAYLSYGFPCLFARRAGKNVLKALLGKYKSFGDTPRFGYYRLSRAVALVLNRSGP
jgi:hypothetical protein